MNDQTNPTPGTPLSPGTPRNARLEPGAPPTTDRRAATPDPDYSGLERRRGAGRRLSDFGRSAEEGDLTPEQFLFVMAIDEFKKANQKTYPSWTDVLEVIRLLGYRKTCGSELKIRSAEDWHEKADAPSNVRPRGWDRRFKDAA